jgi:hypothetical protein
MRGIFPQLTCALSVGKQREMQQKTILTSALATKKSLQIASIIPDTLPSMLQTCRHGRTMASLRENATFYRSHLLFVAAYMPLLHPTPEIPDGRRIGRTWKDALGLRQLTC